MDVIEKFFAFELVGGNTVKNASLFFLCLFATLVVARVVQALFRDQLRRFADKSETKLDDVVLNTFERPLYWILLAFGVSLALGMLVFPTGLERAVDNVTTVVVMFFIGWSASNFVTAVREAYVDPIVEKTESRLDDQLLPIAEKTLKATVWVFVLLIAFDNIGFDVVSLITGLGIGGLALAMAAKDTLSNLFGSVTVIADRPFQVGDVVTLRGQTGNIVDIGLRTCRVETLDRRFVTVPNSLLVGDVIENLSRDGSRAHVSSIGLEYGTTSEQLDAAMEALRQILAAQDHVKDDFAVRFGSFGDSALMLDVIYSIDPPALYLDVISAVNLAVKRRFDAEGWAFAFPSMTLYRADG